MDGQLDGFGLGPTLGSGTACGSHARMRRVDPLMLSVAVACGDIAMVLLSGVLTHILVFGTSMTPSLSDAVKIVVAAGLAVIVNGEAQLYEAPMILTGRLRVGRLAFAWISASGLLLLLLLIFRVIPGLHGQFATTAGAAERQPAADGWLICLLGGNFLLLLAGRMGVNRLIKGLAIGSAAATRVAILGSGSNAQLFLHSLHSQLPIHVVAVVDDETSAEATGRPTLPDLNSLIAKIRRAEVDMVVIAWPWSAVAQVREAVRLLSATPVDIRLAPDLAAFHYRDAPVSYVGGVPLLNVRDRPVAGWSRLVKKAEDLLVASALLLLLAPLMLVVAVLIKIDSAGPVLFRQSRYGFNNRLIGVLKFRTMHEALRDDGCERQTVRDDARVTRLGMVLRRFSLDELPQLFNVLKGEMSVVGPRPHAVATKAAGLLFEDAVGDYMARHQVKPGITGWAQVNGWRGETDTVEKLRKRVEYDLHYIHNWSLLFDLAIMVMTLRCLVHDRNAY